MIFSIYGLLGSQLFAKSEADLTVKENLQEAEGDYYSGIASNEVTLLRLAKSGEYSIRRIGCLGEHEHSRGAWRQENDVIKMSAYGKGFEHLYYHRRGCGRLKIVRWGGRQYLLHPHAIVDFCNDVNAGAEPRSRIIGTEFLRGDDWNIEVRGYPSLPSKYMDYILKKPIVGKILRLKSVGFGENLKARAVLNVGKINGLKKGMQLYDVSGNRAGTLEVTKVLDEYSVVNLHIPNVEYLPKVGATVSTRFKWAKH